MRQTLKILKRLFEDKEIAAPSEPNFSEPFLVNLDARRPALPDEKIAERAFMIWEERGCGHGNHREDWLLAKLQLEDEYLG